MAYKSIRSLSGQTWVDMALQQLGDEARLFELCDINGVGITDDLFSGTDVLYPTLDAEKKDVVKTLQQIRPASNQALVAVDEGEGIEYWAVEGDLVVGGSEGVEFWGIEFDFIVS